MQFHYRSQDTLSQVDVRLRGEPRERQHAGVLRPILRPLGEYVALVLTVVALR